MIPKPPPSGRGFLLSRLRLLNPRGGGTMTDRPKTNLPTTDLQSQLQGLWLALITPVRGAALDEPSLRRLVGHYASGPVDGLILAATSGEGMALGITELEQLVMAVPPEISAIQRHMPAS